MSSASYWPDESVTRFIHTKWQPTFCAPSCERRGSLSMFSKANHFDADKVRFRNHVSTLPQPNFDDSATKIRHASATKKRRFRNQKRTDSATKNNRFRNQKKTIPQPKKGDSATKTRGFRNQKKAIHQPLFEWLRNQHPRHNCGHSQHSIVSRCRGVAWGGVGWDNNVLAAAFLPLTHLWPHSTWNRPQPHSTWHRLQMRGVGWGGVGWDNNVLAAAFLPLTHLRPHSTWHRLQMRGGGVGWGGIITSWQLRSFLWHTCGHIQHGIVSRCGGVGWGGIITSWQLLSFLWHTCSQTQHGIVSRCGGWGGVGWGGIITSWQLRSFLWHTCGHGIVSRWRDNIMFQCMETGSQEITPSTAVLGRWSRAGSPLSL